MVMTEKLKAIYKDGTFTPQANFFLPNNTKSEEAPALKVGFSLTAVELSVYRYCSLQTDIINPEARKEVLNNLLQRMKKQKNQQSL